MFRNPRSFSGAHLAPLRSNSAPFVSRRIGQFLSEGNRVAVDSYFRSSLAAKGSEDGKITPVYQLPK